ncbi:MAG: hypothetical protein GY754_17420 [bacterium]|nr:hypothetical protein [bacterium]
MKKITIYILLVLALLPGCSENKDILATYSGGSITREDLHRKIKDGKLSIKAFEKKKAYQKKELQMIAIDRIAIQEAMKQGFDKSDRFNFLFDDVRSRYLGAFLMNRVIDSNGYTEKAVKINHILLKMQIDSNGEKKRVLSVARKIIALLNQGKPFKDLAKTYSEDITRNNNGQFGYVIEGMFPEKYTRAAFALKKGEYTKQPVILEKRKRVFIIQAGDIVNLTPQNIESVITNKKMVASYKKMILRKARIKYAQKLKNASDVSFNNDLILSPDPAAVLFSIGNKKFSIEHINKRISMIKTISNVKNSLEFEGSRKKIIDNYFISLLLNREAKKQGVHKNPEYLEKINFMKNFYLAGDFMEYLSVKDISIPNEDITKEYNRNKNKIYSRVVTRGSKQVRVPKPFNEVKSTIEMYLINSKALQFRSQWIKDILAKYEYTVNDGELKGV